MYRWSISLSILITSDLVSDEPYEPEGSDDIGDEESGDMYDPTMPTMPTELQPVTKPAPTKVPAKPAATTAPVCTIGVLLSSHNVAAYKFIRLI